MDEKTKKKTYCKLGGQIQGIVLPSRLPSLNHFPRLLGGHNLLLSNGGGHLGGKGGLVRQGLDDVRLLAPQLGLVALDHEGHGQRVVEGAAAAVPPPPGRPPLEQPRLAQRQHLDQRPPQAHLDDLALLRARPRRGWPEAPVPALLAPVARLVPPRAHGRHVLQLLDAQRRRVRRVVGLDVVLRRRLRPVGRQHQHRVLQVPGRRRGRRLRGRRRRAGLVGEVGYRALLRLDALRIRVF